MFRFTIRDVLWLTVVVGSAIAAFLRWQKADGEAVRRRNWESTRAPQRAFAWP